MITSQVAGGLWMPFGFDSVNKTLTDPIAKETFFYYKDGIEKGRYKGLSFKKVVVMGIKSQASEVLGGLIFKTNSVRVDFGNGTLHDADSNKLAVGISYEDKGWITQPDPET